MTSVIKPVEALDSVIRQNLRPSLQTLLKYIKSVKT